MKRYWRLGVLPGINKRMSRLPFDDLFDEVEEPAPLDEGESDLQSSSSRGSASKPLVADNIVRARPTNIQPRISQVESPQESILKSPYLIGGGLFLLTIVALAIFQPSLFGKLLGSSSSPPAATVVTPSNTIPTSTTPTPPTTTAISTTVAIPMTVGLTDAQASAALGVMGLRVQFNAIPSVKKRGTVLQSLPAAGVVARRGTLVTLVVANGEKPPPRTIQMKVAGRSIAWLEGSVPTIVGLSFKDAKKVMQHAGYRLGVSRYEVGATPGSVLSQRPTPGQKLGHGKKVFVAISKKAPTPAKPAGNPTPTTPSPTPPATTTPAPTPTTPSKPKPPTTTTTPAKPVTPPTTTTIKPSKPPTISNGHLFFTRTGSNSIDLYEAYPGAARVMISGGANEISPDASPDGKLLTYSSDRTGKGDIYLTDSAGSYQKNLTQDQFNDLDPSFSPDGKQIIFVSDRGGRGYGLYSIIIATGHIQLVYADGSDIHNPSFSPDGNNIVFSSNKYGDQDIFVISANGGKPRPLVSYRDSNEDNPHYSPDGSKIVFSSNKGGSNQIFIVASDLSTLPKALTSSGDNQHPVFSPDGKQIAFDSDRSGTRAIFVMDNQGGNEKQIALGYDPTWQAIFS